MARKGSDRDRLERLVDTHGLARVAEMLGEIAAVKAAHIRENWQDECLAQEWDAAAEQLDNLNLDEGRKQ